MKNLLTLISILFITSSCRDNTLTPNSSNLLLANDLLGSWEYDSHEKINDSTYSEVYKKVKSIAITQPGLTFKNNGILIIKQNAGWCGTPPISYSNYNGKYAFVNNEEISINTTYWGGKLNYKAQILEVSADKLKIKSFDYKYQ